MVQKFRPKKACAAVYKDERPSLPGSSAAIRPQPELNSGCGRFSYKESCGKVEAGAAEKKKFNDCSDAKG